MTRAVFGFCMYGIGDPFDIDPGGESPALVLYTNGELPSSGLPAELTVLGQPPVIRPIIPVDGLPGVNFGANPRSPVGSGGTLTIRLIDDETGSLGKLFLTDDDAQFWLLQNEELLASDVDLYLKGYSTPDQRVYYVGNEAMFLEAINGSSEQTWDIEVTRGFYGSIPQARSLAPRDYAPGEDGSGDAVLVTKKPNWDNGFYCGLYLFLLGAEGQYVSHILRRGVVVGEPTPKARPYYDIQVKMLEDHTADHQIGEESRVVSLSKKIVVEEADINSDQSYPVHASLRLTREEAETFFNFNLHKPGSTVMTSARVAELKARLFQDPEIKPQLVIDEGDTWVFSIDDLILITNNNANTGAYTQSVKVKLTLITQSPGATILGS
jgi:hypothetical protein